MSWATHPSFSVSHLFVHCFVSCDPPLFLLLYPMPSPCFLFWLMPSRSCHLCMYFALFSGQAHKLLVAMHALCYFLGHKFNHSRLCPFLFPLDSLVLAAHKSKHFVCVSLGLLLIFTFTRCFCRRSRVSVCLILFYRDFLMSSPTFCFLWRPRASAWVPVPRGSLFFSPLTCCFCRRPRVGAPLVLLVLRFLICPLVFLVLPFPSLHALCASVDHAQAISPRPLSDITPFCCVWRIFADLAKQWR